MARKAPTSDADLYRYHVANLRSIERALGQVQLLCRDAIRKDQQSLVGSLLRTHILLVGAWTECRLKKLLFENNGFQPTDRTHIRKQRSQEERWRAAIDIGFKRRYKLRRLSRYALEHTASARRQAMLSSSRRLFGRVVAGACAFGHGGTRPAVIASP